MQWLFLVLAGTILNRCHGHEMPIPLLYNITLQFQPTTSPMSFDDRYSWFPITSATAVDGLTYCGRLQQKLVRRKGLEHGAGSLNMTPPPDRTRMCQMKQKSPKPGNLLGCVFFTLVASALLHTAHLRRTCSRCKSDADVLSRPRVRS
ncbi:hypothetical protein VaNZ11_003088 [Volvox africanus]|uniref:Secreted protein n=1 Tax=Volvox africanus TaxID=51714 RepID=A0ABQ5RTE6_9CHLO|nr:hypothetical protein VaNZ11_003088 [Volvox africanus]